MQNPYLLIILFAVIGIFIGALVVYLMGKIKYSAMLSQQKEDFETQLSAKEKELLEAQQLLKEEKLQSEKKALEWQQNFETEKHQLEKSLQNTIIDLEKIVDNQRVQLNNWKEKWQAAQEDFKQKEEMMRKEFELLAQRILEEKSKKFTELNQDNMKQILNPFQEAMKAFKEKVEQNEKESHGRHQALQQQLEQLQKLNQQISQEALNLTKALKGESKTQGIWGETILNRLLEKSGLEKGREYFVQESFQATDDSVRQRLQPDVVIQLPDNKKLIIDAKVSLTAYERYVNEDDEKLQDNFAKQHLTSLKTHISGLAKKSYDELLEGESPEFILMFIPMEPAFSLALKEDHELYNYAFERNIVLVTPTTLLATLKIVDNMWRNEKQRQNAFEIAKQAGALYDKFHGLIVDLEQVKSKLSGAEQSFETAMNKLHTGKGNLISRVEKLKQLGAKAKKQLPKSGE